MQQLALFEAMKRCSKCGEEKPATREYFYKSNRTVDGWRGKCIECFAEYSRERNQIPEVKQRTKEYQREYYQDPENRERKNEYQRQWRENITEEHKERHRAQKREYMKEYDRRPESRERDRQYRKWYNKLPHRQEQLREYRKQYYQRPEVKRRLQAWRKSKTAKKIQRRYYQNHREKILQDGRDRRETYEYQEWKRQWSKGYRQRPDARKKQWIHTINRRARKRNLPDTLTSDQIQQMLEYFDHRCAVCGTPQDLFIKLELDHWIPLSSDDCTGTIATNIVPLCGGSEFASHVGCNPSKNSKDAMEWLIDKFGKRKANKIMKRIEDYFEWAKSQ